MDDRVPVSVFHERYYQLRERGVSDREMAERVGWMRRYKKGQQKMVGDTARLRRNLGLQPESAGFGHGKTRYTRTSVGYNVAVKLTQALDLDPVDVGI